MVNFFVKRRACCRQRSVREHRPVHAALSGYQSRFRGAGHGKRRPILYHCQVSFVRDIVQAAEINVRPGKHV